MLYQNWVIYIPGFEFKNPLLNLSSGAVNSHRLLCSQMFVLKLSCKQNKSVSDFVFKVKNFLHTSKSGMVNSTRNYNLK